MEYSEKKRKIIGESKGNHPKPNNQPADRPTNHQQMDMRVRREVAPRITPYTWSDHVPVHTKDVLGRRIAVPREVGHGVDEELRHIPEAQRN